MSDLNKTIENLSDARTEKSVPYLLSQLIDSAIKGGASDVHIDPTDSLLQVRLRVDGQLLHFDPLPRRTHAEVISRLKVLAGLRTDEHFRAQDGRFGHETPQGTVSIRLSIAPTYYGENAVLRLLRASGEERTLSSCGFTQKHEQDILSLLNRSHGMLLVTGPTGSGKTTTLYACMQALVQRPLSIVSIEDPVEYPLEGVVQIQANTATGFTFANSLRSVLRQDPDVIMVGEIRDGETARLAVNAALTGHLVLSTLHTNDASSAPLRLVDLGVEPYLVASTLNLVISQRLVRKNCTACVQRIPVSEWEGTRLRSASFLPTYAYKSIGCDRCGESGYAGRTGVFEFLACGNRIQEAIAQKVSQSEMRKLARAAGAEPT
jgi:type II secretory ATPase GspE/PulE/Tfp pilus assembly ATPase PilB-like protein